MKQYCLIGEKLIHSYSAIIHKEFGYSYTLREVKREDLETFAKSGEYNGFNVTIPYKKDIIPFLDYIDPIAARVGAVNTVIRVQDKLYGYNTDIDGMDKMLKSKGITLKGKKVVILGSGGTSITAKALAETKRAEQIVVVGRSGENNYQNLYKNYDAQVIINTTPIGTYPNNCERIINISDFKKLESVVDVIYNPLMTDLILQAKARGLKYVSGLKMLVAQAKYARDIFVGEKITDAEIDRIYKKLMTETLNIVLIGMPSSGKSSVGKLLAEKFNKTFVDTDSEIEKMSGKSVQQIFNEDGEPTFRAKEREMLEKFGKERGQIISVGGGAVKADNAYVMLKQNGIIVHLKRDLDKTDITGRPLLQNNSATVLEKLYNERMPIYNAFADIIADNNGNINDTVKFIEEKVYENIGD